MKILVVSFRFPPYNSVGAVSVGKTVKYLEELNHDVRVVMARNQQVPRTVPVEIDVGSVVTTGWWNPMRFAENTAGGRARVEATGFSAGRKHEHGIHRIGRIYRSIMIPDKQIGWAWPAFRAGRRIVNAWHPDVIYASAPPFTSLVAAGALAFRTGIPWIAGLRDLWTDNPYRRIRLAGLDGALELRVLRSAAGIVVTTEEAEDVVRTRFRVPTATVMNGYDPQDVREGGTDSHPGLLRIVHTGSLIHDRRDPAPLFDAMRARRAQGQTVMAEFYGRDSVVVMKTAERASVADLVRAHGPISYEDSLQAQRDADVNLLIQSNDADERRICPAKIFEYAAARRPVLAIVPNDGVAARLVTAFGFGVVAQGADDIGAQLRGWYERKMRDGRLPDVAERPPDELSRRTQVQKLSDFVEGLLASSGKAPRQPANGPDVRAAAWPP